MTINPAIKVLLLGFAPRMGYATAELGLVPGRAERVTKNIVSDQFRLVFPMGLEGSGHHYFMPLEERTFREHPDLPRLSDFRLNTNLYFAANTLNTSPSHFFSSRASATAEMREMAKRAEEVPWPGTLQIQLGALSYPSNNGPQKVFGYVDMRLMAETAEAEGVDFRVLYLRRSAKDLVIANTVHRTFQE